MSDYQDFLESGSSARVPLKYGKSRCNSEEELPQTITSQLHASRLVSNSENVVFIGSQFTLKTKANDSSNTNNSVSLNHALFEGRARSPMYCSQEEYRQALGSSIKLSEIADKPTLKIESIPSTNAKLPIINSSINEQISDATRNSNNLMLDTKDNISNYFGLDSSFYQEEPLQATVPKSLHPRPTEDLMSRVENNSFVQNHIFSMVNSKNVPTSDIAFLDNEYLSDCNSIRHDFVNKSKMSLKNLNSILAREENGNMNLENVFTSNLARGTDTNTGSEHLLSGKYEDVCIKEANKPVANDNLSDKRLEEIANQLWAISGVNNPGDKNLDDVNCLSLSNISIDYWRLYSETRPEDFDFAMNIMAYIELLNDNHWKTTISYFDENVKKMVKDIWNEKKDGVNNMIDLQSFQSGAILKLMADFTEWTINRKYDFGEFLNYCVLLCQVGVIARNHSFKKAPLYVIGQLRERIKLFKFEYFVQIMFEIAVKEYARKLL